MSCLLNPFFKKITKGVKKFQAFDIQLVKMFRKKTTRIDCSETFSIKFVDILDIKSQIEKKIFFFNVKNNCCVKMTMIRYLESRPIRLIGLCPFLPNFLFDQIQTSCSRAICLKLT